MMNMKLWNIIKKTHINTHTSTHTNEDLCGFYSTRDYALKGFDGLGLGLCFIIKHYI